MYKTLKIFFSIIFTLSIFVSNSYSATGAADVYKITMRKVELCTGSTGVTNCDNAVVIGSGDKVVDIASVTAGAAAASYGDPALLPLGETYTHMRVTIDRKFVIKNNRFYSFLCYKKNMKSNLSISSIAHETKLLIEKGSVLKAACILDGEVVPAEAHLVAPSL